MQRADQAIDKRGHNSEKKKGSGLVRIYGIAHKPELQLVNELARLADGSNVQSRIDRLTSRFLSDVLHGLVWREKQRAARAHLREVGGSSSRLNDRLHNRERPSLERGLALLRIMRR